MVDTTLGWPGPTAAGDRTEPTTGEFERLVSADHPDQRLIAHRLLTPPLSLRVDPAHILPLGVFEGRGHLVARFRTAYEAAVYLDAHEPGRPLRRVSLPMPIAEAMQRLASADLATQLRREGLL